MRASVSSGSTVFGLFFHLKKVERAVSPSRAICSPVERFQSAAIPKNVRNAGPDRPLRSKTVVRFARAVKICPPGAPR